MSLIRADSRAIPLRDGCVQCIVTSPPYWGLRDYGVPGQIGLESSPDAYVSTLVAVFADVRRVLTDDGVCWLNLGDSYSSNSCIGRKDQDRPNGLDLKAGKKRSGRDDVGVAFARNINRVADGTKPKDLIGIPWRVAFALQADGWYLRADVIWSKPNPMPESVTDRPTKAHEYIFLLTKSARYYYDADAIAEVVTESMAQQVLDGYDGEAVKEYEKAGVQNPSTVKARIIANARKSLHMQETQRNDGDRWRLSEGGVAPRGTRNKRSVWHVATQPYADAHFATFPEALVQPCILAGSRVGDLVCDPFIGSGTVGAVAERLARRWVGIDLNPAYTDLAHVRTAQRGLRF